VDIGQKMNMEVLTPLRGGWIDGVEHLLTGETSPDVTVVHPHNEHHNRMSYYRELDDVNSCPEILAVRDVTILLDFGEMINGHFLLEVTPSPDRRTDERPPDAADAPADLGQIDIAWTQELSDGRVDSRFHPADPGKQDGMFNLSHAARYTLRGGRQTWESFHYQQFRYIRVTFRNLEGPLTVHAFGAIRVEAPLTRQGRFASSEPMLDWSYEASARTFALCCHDNCLDNVVRERGVYSGDIGLAFITSGLSLFGDNALLRNAIRLFTRQREDRRYLRMVLDAYAPGPEKGIPVIPIHALYESYALCEYLRWMPPNDAVKSEYYPVLTDVADYFLQGTNSDGLIEDPKGWPWMDWADLDNRRGIVAPQNLMLALYLRELAEISELLGEPRRAAADRAAAARITDHIRRHHWNDEAGLYVDAVVDGKQRTHVFSEHTNSLAMLGGIAGGERGRRIVATLFEYHPRHVQAEVGFMLFVIKGLLHAGFDAKALELVRTRYHRLAGRGMATIPEEWSWRASVARSDWRPAWRSVAQAAGCVTPWIITREILGIRPTELGFRAVEIAPRIGLLERADGAVITPFGELALGWRRRGTEIELTVVVPDGVQARLALPGRESVALGAGRHVRRVPAEQQDSKSSTVGTAYDE
jgi:alpha-L-rhamnosidase